ncbi:hypothetical protein LCGC14_1743590 [marine sediment metagenome]|uniref:Enoyl-CoA hydratase n=1 Tax=marine sediment metagenome TaxID=412755 RepID=A0A0F9HTL2_9ZZZZ
MEFETVIYETKKKIGYITLNRPEKHNALNYLSRLYRKKMEESIWFTKIMLISFRKIRN